MSMSERDGDGAPWRFRRMATGWQCEGTGNKRPPESGTAEATILRGNIRRQFADSASAARNARPSLPK